MRRKTFHDLAEAPDVFVPLEESRAAHAADAAWLEKRLGPDVPAQLVRPRGRPKKGTSVEPTKVHAVRIKVSAWKAFEKKARAAGLSPNAALQLAAAEWAARH